MICVFSMSVITLCNGENNSIFNSIYFLIRKGIRIIGTCEEMLKLLSFPILFITIGKTLFYTQYYIKNVEFFGAIYNMLLKIYKLIKIT